MTVMVPKVITIHCSDTPNGEHVSIEAMTQDHIARGFGGLGYHMVIQPDGEVVNGRGLNEVGAHVADHNTGNVGICLVGNDRFTRAQLDALRYKLDSLILTYDVKAWEIFCHRQWDTAIAQGKTCPNIQPNHLMYWYACKDDRAIDQYLLR